MYTRAEGIVKANYIKDELDEKRKEQLQRDIAEYGKFKKKAGARSLAKLVKEMRSAQNEYFKNAGTPVGKQKLAESKKLEAQVDRACEAVLS